MARSGFTLIEVLVALTLAGLGVMVAAGTFGGSADLVALLDARAVARDREANARGWLADAFAGIDVGPEPGRPFHGGPDGVSFHTRLRVSEGWLEESVLELAFDPPRLVARWDVGSTITLADSVRAVAFDYLDRLGAGAPWLSRWQSSIAPPLAVRIRALGSAGEADTMLFLIGERR